MTVLNFLIELRQQGIEILDEKGMLRCRARIGMLTPALRNQLSENKALILEVLRRESAQARDDRPDRTEAINHNESPTEQSFPISIVRAGDPAVCTNCSKAYLWLPFPALANICRDCQPASVGWIPDLSKPRFEGDLEFRTGPGCYACGAIERWRRSKLGPWICKACHPPA